MLRIVGYENLYILIVLSEIVNLVVMGLIAARIEAKIDRISRRIRRERTAGRKVMTYRPEQDPAEKGGAA